MEDLDRLTSSPQHALSQLADLDRLGLHWDGEVVRQSERIAHHRAALDELADAGRLYPCYCTRREIRDAASAPHGPSAEGTYPGTCRSLSDADRRRREREGRPAGVAARRRWPTGRARRPPRRAVRRRRRRRRARRNDGVPAYNLAVVVDDAAQGVTEVVRGDDLLSSTPRQLLTSGGSSGCPPPSHLHVPLVLGADGARLAKRHGAVTLRRARRRRRPACRGAGRAGAQPRAGRTRRAADRSRARRSVRGRAPAPRTVDRRPRHVGRSVPSWQHRRS